MSRRVLTILLAAVLFLAGVAVGVGGDRALTEAVTETETKVETVATTVTVKATPPPAANRREITVDYGESEGLFQLSGLRVTERGSPSHYYVVGTFLYPGSADCELDFVRVDATIYNDGRVVDDGLWGQSNVKEGVPYDFEIDAGTGPLDRVEIEPTDVYCS